jgi:hypothetical protein
MIKNPSALGAAPSKEQVYKIFSRLLRQWPEDPLRPTRSIRNLKPIQPSNPAFDEHHYFYQSAAMKVILSNKIRSHVISILRRRLILKYKLSDEYMNPQCLPQYYVKFRERLDREGLPRERGGLMKRFWDYLTGKEKSIN